MAEPAESGSNFRDFVSKDSTLWPQSDTSSVIEESDDSIAAELEQQDSPAVPGLRRSQAMNFETMNPSTETTLLRRRPLPIPASSNGDSGKKVKSGAVYRNDEWIHLNNGGSIQIGNLCEMYENDRQPPRRLANGKLVSSPVPASSGRRVRLSDGSFVGLHAVLDNYMLIQEKQLRELERKAQTSDSESNGSTENADTKDESGDDGEEEEEKTVEEYTVPKKLQVFARNAKFRE